MPSHRPSLRWPEPSIFRRPNKDRVFDVKVDWVGLDEGYSSWEPLAIIWDGASQFVKSELRKLRVDRGVRSHLRNLYDVTLSRIGAYFIVKLV